MAYKCVLCPGFSALLLNTLLWHFNTKHCNDCNFYMYCGIEGCSRKYRIANSLVKHARSNHAKYLLCSSSLESKGEPTKIPMEALALEANVGDTSCEGQAANVGSEDQYCSNEEDDTQEGEFFEQPLVEDTLASDSNSDSDNSSDVMLPLESTVKKYMTKIKGQPQISSSAMQDMNLATCHLARQTVRVLKKSVKDLLNSASDAIQVNDELDKLFDDAASDLDLLQLPVPDNEGDGTHVEIRKCVLGSHPDLVKRGNKRKIIQVEDKFYYVSVLDTLRVQLCCPRVLEMILYGHTSWQTCDAHVFEDFYDGGEFMKIHELFSSDDKALVLLLYVDDVNMVNPLTNKHHKISFFYYQIANLPPKYRSKLKSIQLFGICKAEFLSNSSYGFNKVIEPLVDDLKILGRDEGFVFNLGRGSVRLRGAALAFLADTPASQKVGGFKEGVGFANKKCRHCMAGFEDMQSCFSEEQFQLRSYDLHSEHLNLIESAPSAYLTKFYSKTFGINSRSLLAEAPYFNVCEQLIQDIMHVFLEGVLTYEIRLLLNRLITDDILSLKELNSKIEQFSYGYSHVKNKPALIRVPDLEQTSSSNLGQKASQMWLLSCILPFILVSFNGIDTDSNSWKCYISLVEIMSYCFAHKISLTTTVYLRRAIQSHLTLFKSVYDKNIIPKQHYLIHLPSMINQFGPLIRSWCMHMEAKHSYFKDQAKIVRNFKNLPFSLASRYVSNLHADSISLDESDDGPLFRNELTFGRSKVVDLDDGLRVKIEQWSGQGSLNGVMDFFQLQSVELCGIRYKVDNNAFLHFGYSNGLPEFGQIVKIGYLQRLKSVFFALDVFNTVKLSERFNAYEVEAPSDTAQEYKLVIYSNIATQQVFHICKCQYKTYIILKENVLDHTSQ